MTRRFWQFTLIALAGTLIVAFALSVSYRQIAIENLTEMRAEHNAEVARSLWNALAPDLEELLAVDVAGWLAELPGVEEHFDKFGDRLPGELREELAALRSRLEAAK